MPRTKPRGPSPDIRAEPAISIAGVKATDPKRPYIIAEASGNHARDKDFAHALVKAAYTAGADAIKFQTFEASEIAAAGVTIPTGHDAAHDAWLRGHGVTQLTDLFKLGGLPRDWHADLKAHAEQLGLAFLSTPFSLDAARFLIDLGVPAIKIASGDLTFRPLLKYVDDSGLPIILSTGGATLHEIRLAITHDLFNTYQRGKLAILHCRSVYPCPLTDVQLGAIRRLALVYPAATIGWSDHTLSQIAVPALAVASGATIIEKHLALSADIGVDAGHSLDPTGFKQMVDICRAVPVMIGDGSRAVLPAEMHDRVWARRSSKDWLRPTEEGRLGAWEEDGPRRGRGRRPAGAKT